MARLVDLMTTPTLRAASVADLDALVRLAVVFRNHRGETEPSKDALRSAYARLLVDPGSEFLIAEDESAAPIGFLLMRFRHASFGAGLSCEVEDLFVLAEARRRGVGRELLARAIERAAARGAIAMGLTTNERNADALSIYYGQGLVAERARWGGARALWLERAIEPQSASSAEGSLLAVDHVQLAMPPGGEAKARAFYGALLGLDEREKPADLAQRGGCWFERGALRVHLGVEPEFHPARKAHPAFRVAGLEALLARCRAAGAAVGPVDERGDERRAYVDDPFGNRIELVEMQL